MNNKDTMYGIAKHTIAFRSYAFDIGSDFVNVLNLRMYCNPLSTSETSSSFDLSNSLINLSNVISNNDEKSTYAFKYILKQI